MKAIELTQALINASEATINKVDALVETCVLRQLIESCKARVDLLEDEALSIAEQQLAAHGATSGKFMYLGHHYTMDSVPVFDLIGNPNKYNTAEAATYRRKAREQQKLKNQSAMLTRDMKNIMEGYPGSHPNLAPDALKRTLKCLD